MYHQFILEKGYRNQLRNPRNNRVRHIWTNHNPIRRRGDASFWCEWTRGVLVCNNSFSPWSSSQYPSKQSDYISSAHACFSQSNNTLLRVFILRNKTPPWNVWCMYIKEIEFLNLFTLICAGGGGAKSKAKLGCVLFCAVQNLATIEFKLVYANSLLKLEWHFYPWKDHVNQGSHLISKALIL